MKKYLCMIHVILIRMHKFYVYRKFIYLFIVLSSIFNHIHIKVERQELLSSYSAEGWGGGFYCWPIKSIPCYKAFLFKERNCKICRKKNQRKKYVLVYIVRTFMPTNLLPLVPSNFIYLNENLFQYNSSVIN